MERASVVVSEEGREEGREGGREGKYNYRDMYHLPHVFKPGV